MRYSTFLSCSLAIFFLLAVNVSPQTPAPGGPPTSTGGPPTGTGSSPAGPGGGSKAPGGEGKSPDAKGPDAKTSEGKGPQGKSPDSKAPGDAKSPGLGDSKSGCTCPGEQPPPTTQKPPEDTSPYPNPLDFLRVSQIQEEEEKDCKS
ncbi:hypothetical protein BY996DRAFT_6420068 [Phakopsora pachyrhizi]|nr:hypothetical protein BY996DRAFT_6420068 [Phakopsora pachyrhizi]